MSHDHVCLNGRCKCFLVGKGRDAGGEDVSDLVGAWLAVPVAQTGADVKRSVMEALGVLTREEANLIYRQTVAMTRVLRIAEHDGALHAEIASALALLTPTKEDA